MKKLLIPVFVLFFTACAQLGMADTFNKRVAAAYETVAVVADTARTLKASGAITESERNKVAAADDTALQAIDAAKALAGTDLTAADSRLTSAIAILTAMQAFLATKGSK